MACRTEAGRKKHNNRVNCLMWMKVRLVNNLPDDEIIAGAVERYGYKESSAEKYLQKAKDLLIAAETKTMEAIVEKNVERLTAIAEAASDGDSYADAIKAIDLLNKMSGAYIEKKEVKLEGNNITFQFGE